MSAHESGQDQFVKMSATFSESNQSLDSAGEFALKRESPLGLASLDSSFREQPAECNQTRDQVGGVTNNENVHGQVRPTSRVGHFQTPNQPPETNQQTAKSYPNNTLVEDLTRCHQNLWPGVARATIKITQLASSCWPRSNPFAMANSRSQLKAAVKPERNQREQANNRKHETKSDVRFPMPNSILRLNSTLTQDDYNRALCILTNDVRYKLHILLFRRLQTIWTLFSTVACVLIPMLTLSSLSILTTIAACSVWLLLQAVGFAMCKHARKQLDRMLERSVAQANSFFMDHKLMLGVINVGGLTTQSRFVVPLLYFDAFQCIERIELLVGLNQNATRRVCGLDWRSKQDRAHAHSQPIQRGFAQTQFAKRVVLNYSQRWVSQFDRSKLLLSDDGSRPRHLSTGKCLCQFIEENLDGAAKTSEVRRSLDSGDEMSARSRQRQTLSTETKTLDSANRKETIISIPYERVGLEIEPDKQEVEVARPRLVKPLLSSSLATDCHELSVASLVQSLKQRDNFKKIESGNLDNSDKMVDTFVGHSQHEDERAESACSPETELSLDLDSDECFASRNEELFNSLKLLLELRSSELSKSLDGVSTVTFRNRSSLCSSYATSHYGQRQKHRVGSAHSDTFDGRPSEKSDDNNVSTNQIGKGFFARVDGLFSLGFKRSKCQGFYDNSKQQMLEIC